MGEFPDDVVEQAWARSGGNCECSRVTHWHVRKCNKVLSKHFRGDRDSEYCWEAHHISASGGDTLSNCEILCCKCHYATF
jgi:hypothetical protein